MGTILDHPFSNTSSRFLEMKRSPVPENWTIFELTNVAWCSMIDNILWSADWSCKLDVIMRRNGIKLMSSLWLNILQGLPKAKSAVPVDCGYHLHFFMIMFPGFSTRSLCMRPMAEMILSPPGVLSLSLPLETHIYCQLRDLNLYSCENSGIWLTRVEQNEIAYIL